MYSLMGLGFEFTGILLIPAGLGFLLDEWIWSRGAGFFFVLFFLVGFAYGIYYLVRTGLNALNEGFEDETPRKEESIEDRSRSVQSGMEDVGKKLADYEEEWRKRKS